MLKGGFRGFPPELIDTLWNVNSSEKIIKADIDFELIDTLWNVNDTTAQIFWLKNRRINRYIMECKCKCCNHSRGQGDELIDTLWNVNCRKLQTASARQIGINRYIMECKLFRLNVLSRM